MPDEVSRVHGPSINKSIQQAQKAEKAQHTLLASARQSTSESRFEQWSETGALFNPRQLQKKFEKLEDKIQKSPREEQAQKSEKQKGTAAKAFAAEETAEAFSQRNPELQKKTLLLLTILKSS